jgi:hypothetical protein
MKALCGLSPTQLGRTDNSVVINNICDMSASFEKFDAEE